MGFGVLESTSGFRDKRKTRRKEREGVGGKK
jgi:hypothetical protein